MRLRAILVEDSPTIRENLIPAMAELARVSVLAVAEGAPEAIAALREYEDVWDLAVVDLFLKEGSGLAVIRACVTRREDQHVIVLTNYPTAEMRARCAALGADRIFDKSTELEAFFAACNAYGDEKRSDAHSGGA